MIKVKTEQEVLLMRQAGKVAAAARRLAGEMATVGATTQSIDKRVHDFILSQGAEPSFLGYNEYPASICISINEQVIHGIPSSRKLVPGDLVSIDIGATKGGFVGDCAATFVVGEGSPKAMRLVEVTKQCFFEGLKFAKVGYRVSDISRAIQKYAEKNGYSVVREYVGHGVGSKVHEPPEVPNYVERPRRKPDPRLMPGMTLAVEPMINAGGAAIRVLDDGWTVITADGECSAHYENTILITKGEPEILTADEEDS
ncbi:MAG: type I methionyl aminopeptidase [Oscillospiraceae bacterium]|nr:type I methionyl aminopeptidase [Oscillospiraceae bacterium]